MIIRFYHTFKKQLNIFTYILTFSLFTNTYFPLFYIPFLWSSQQPFNISSPQNIPITSPSNLNVLSILSILFYSLSCVR